MRGNEFICRVQKYGENTMLQFTYAIKLTPDRKDGGYVVTCRDIPEAITQGESADEAIAEAEGALQAAIEGRIEDGSGQKQAT